MSDAESRGPVEFENAEQVKQVMDDMKNRFAGSDALAGIGVLATFASAIATLADEIAKLEARE